MSATNPFDRELAVALGAANGAAQPCVGIYQVLATGPFGGTAKVQIRNGTAGDWIDYPGASFTAPGVFAPLYCGKGVQLRAINSAGTVTIVLVPLE